jgi:hypothetical protein
MDATEDGADWYAMTWGFDWDALEQWKQQSRHALQP